MRFSIVDGEKAEAQPKAKGICPHCQSEMLAKCGRVKVWHWAHKGNPPCDPWWESETEWHREWKDRFPKEWQEITHIDPISGEQHIADVKNPFGQITWWGSESKVKVYLDFGKDVLWRLIMFLDNKFAHW